MTINTHHIKIDLPVRFFHMKLSLQVEALSTRKVQVNKLKMGQLTSRCYLHTNMLCLYSEKSQ